MRHYYSRYFFFNDTATTEIYTLSLHDALPILESPYFPVPFGELPSNVEIEELKDMNFNVGEVRVKAWFANHPGICVGYRLSTDEGSLAFFPDNEPHCRHQGLAATAPTKSRASLAFARAEEQKTIEFLRGTDVLVLDAQ